MKKLATFVSNAGITPLLCCSAAVLLAACGAGSDMTDGQTQTAAMSYSVDTNAAGAPIVGADDSNTDTATQNLVSATADENTDVASTAGAESDAAAPADGSPRLLAMVATVSPT